jgi:hypothetical protein
MKTKFVLALSLLALAFLAVPANAQFFTLTVDEAGNGTLNGTADQGYLAVDPISGLTALTYNLPGVVGSGDVGILDANGQVSDGIRFEIVSGLNNGNSVMFYFSQLDTTNSMMADTGVPAGNFQGFNVPELGEAWTFLAGGGGNNSYFGTSDADNTVPEPSSLLLLGSGLMGLAGFARRRFLS